ncbi:ABC transporter ATP-binding protein [Brevibacillus fluminis]|uniref:ABC transporter ATP-binding protein n=1 Tax=Brevibacillus fluminis TaxID=511487 RepID=UPI003F8B7A7E
MNHVIELDRVCKHFGEKKSVDGISLQIEAGSVVALLGPNGAGKTTTVSLLLGLLKPTSGTIRLLGGSPKEANVRERVGAMLQEGSVIDDLKVEETIRLFRSYYQNPLSTEELLAISSLQKERNQFATALSGGQRRRLSFALAMAGNPDVIFLDEPTVGMDLSSRQLFWETIRSFAGSGRTIIVTTHYLEEAEGIADRVVIMNQGRVLADGTIEQIRESTGNQHVSFLAGPSVTLKSLYDIIGVTDVQREGNRVKVFGPDTDRILFAVVQRGLDIRDISVHKGGLVEAYQSLVG